MPRDNDKNNDSRGRRDRPSGGKGRSGAARGPEKKFAKRGFAGKSDGDKRDGERRPYAGKPDGAKSYGKKPYPGSGKPYAGKREGPSAAPRCDDAPRRDSTVTIAAPGALQQATTARRAKIAAAKSATYTPRGDARCRPTALRQEIRRQEDLMRRARRREAAVYATRRRFRKDGDRPQAIVRTRATVARRRSAREKIWRRQEIFARRSPRTVAQAQGFFAGSCRPRNSQSVAARDDRAKREFVRP